MIETIGGPRDPALGDARSEHAPDIYHPRPVHNFVSRESQEPYRSPVHFHSTRSPVPAYTPYDAVGQSAIVSTPSQSVNEPKSPVSRNIGNTESTVRSTSVHYSEIHSPDPEVVDRDDEKEAYNYGHKHLSGETYVEPVQGIRHTSSTEHPQVFDGYVAKPRNRWRRPWYKRRSCILLLLILCIVIALAIALGIVFGLRRHNSTPASGSNLDPEINTGGYLDPHYYSKDGAFNGSGIAIAAAKPGVDTSIYAFYQVHTGDLMYSLMNPQNQWDLIGPVNAGSYQAMNATPLSTVQHQLGNQSVWHLFYIDVNYYIRERIITNDTTDSPTPIWRDGPLSSLNLKAYQANTIGMQACYWGDYYGRYSVDGQSRTTGIHLWFADSATTFQQYSWSNGTNQWNYEQRWTGLDGHAGVACQTWDSGTTEYVWFVDTNQRIAMYWKDSNQTAVATASHPIGQWTPLNINVGNIQRASSMGYTNYAIYQHQDYSIRGVNIIWAAENTTIANSTQGTPDTFILQAGNKNINALRATHMSLSVLKTTSKGAVLIVFFQQHGNDIRMYTRDATNVGGLWQAAAQDPVTVSTNSRLRGRALTKGLTFQ